MFIGSAKPVSPEIMEMQKMALARQRSFTGYNFYRKIHGIRSLLRGVLCAVLAKIGSGGNS
jgi:hypothetical protein